MHDGCARCGAAGTNAGVIRPNLLALQFLEDHPMPEDATSIVDFFTRKAGIPNELEFVQALTRLQKSPPAQLKPHERAALAHVQAFSRIRRELEPHIYAAILFHIMLAYYGREPVVDRLPELGEETRQVMEEINHRFATGAAADAARQTILRLLDTDLPDSLKHVGLQAVISQLRHKARQQNFGKLH